MKKYLLPIVLFIAGAGMFAFTKFTSGSIQDLDVKIVSTPVVMPAAYKVYGNEDALSGRFFLFKMLITNNGSRPVKNVKASYSIPKFIDETELQKLSQINPGQSVVITCYPSFNDDVVTKTTSAKEKVKIKLESSGGDTEKEFAFEMKSRSDFLYSCIPPDEIRTNADMEDNNPLLACWVTPNDPIVKYYTQQVQEKVLKGEQASVSRKPEEAVRFLMGIYQATYLSGMVYSGTAGVPEKVGDIQSLNQTLRLPREVITGNTGLCIELSLLYASVMMAEGIEPVIYLVPGHAYPGFVLDGQYYALEATAIGGAGLGGRQDAEAAFKAGMKNLEEFMKAAQAGDDRYSIINIRELVAQKVMPMELKDDQFLRQKVDQIAQSFTNGGVPQNVTVQPVANNMAGGNGGGGNENGGGNNEGGNTATGGMASYTGGVSFNYPSSWQKIRSPYAGLPQLIYQISSPDNMAALQVYQVQGAGSGDEALQVIQQQLYAMGQEVQFENNGSRGGFQIYNGMTYSQNGNLPWTGYFKQTGNGVAGLVIADMSGGRNASLKTVLGSLR